MSEWLHMPSHVCCTDIRNAFVRVDECCIVRVRVRKSSLCVPACVCVCLIDIAEAPRLIGSHGDRINRLRRLTSDPENPPHSIGRALSLSPIFTSSHPSAHPGILLLVQDLREKRENKSPAGDWACPLFPSLPYPVCSFILYAVAFVRSREETRRRG